MHLCTKFVAANLMKVAFDWDAIALAISVLPVPKIITLVTESFGLN